MPFPHSSLQWPFDYIDVHKRFINDYKQFINAALGASWGIKVHSAHQTDTRWTRQLYTNSFELSSMVAQRWRRFSTLSDKRLNAIRTKTADRSLATPKRTARTHKHENTHPPCHFCLILTNSGPGPWPMPLVNLASDIIWCVVPPAMLLAQASWFGGSNSWPDFSHPILLSRLPFGWMFVSWHSDKIRSVKCDLDGIAEWKIPYNQVDPYWLRKKRPQRIIRCLWVFASRSARPTVSIFFIDGRK